MGINNAILDIKGQLQTLIGFSRIWNNQFRYMEEGKVESFPMPCTFIEVVMPQDHSQLSSGVTESDVTFKIHIGQNEYDAQDGTLEENKSIFALRDQVVKSLTYYEPSGCSRLMKIREEQDYEHSNVYHYIVEFQCSFIDTTGQLDQFYKQPPTDLNLTVTKVNSL
jgi:hypothetical protein